MTALLRVTDLSIGFGDASAVVSGVNLEVSRGETLALVGESGSGKTLTCRAILRILPGAAQIRGGVAAFDDVPNLLALRDAQMRTIRGNRISMIFQEPMRALSPLHTIGNQVVEVLHLHRGLSGAKAKARVLDAFSRVGFVDPERAWRSYPFEMSGGMRQRAMIAMAIVAEPDLLIADEPTTALDVTTQAQVLGLMKELQRQTGMAMILVTHDLGVVANMADNVVVMHKGRVMEAGTAAQVLSRPGHGYSRKLLAAAPMIPQAAGQVPVPQTGDPILSLSGVCKTYTPKSGSWGRAQKVRACIDVDLHVERGQTLAIVGESGSGKTTCARIALGAEPPDPGGRVTFRATDHAAPLEVHDMSPGQRLAFQRDAQMVFQDPFSSLSPRMRIAQTLTEPQEVHGIDTPAERRARAADMLCLVGLSPDMLQRYPHAFSGGQRQRISIARALMLGPKLLVCDEPTSALDVSVQEQILRLLEDLQARLGLSYLFISHDLAVVARIASQVAVMRRGVIVEQAPPAALFSAPRHPYTKALIAAQPEPDLSRPIDLETVARGAGDPRDWPEQFRFDTTPPGLHSIAPGHQVRCHV